jgi:hypothetical protein
VLGGVGYCRRAALRAVGAELLVGRQLWLSKHSRDRSAGLPPTRSGRIHRFRFANAQYLATPRALERQLARIIRLTLRPMEFDVLPNRVNRSLRL